MKEPENNQHLEFPLGGGITGDLLRAKNWQTHSLGVMANWPLALRQHLQFILHAGSPMFLCWGPQHLFFYNTSWLQNIQAGPGTHLPPGEPASQLFGSTWQSAAELINLQLSGKPVATAQAQTISLWAKEVNQSIEQNLVLCPVYSENGKISGVLAQVNNKLLAPASDNLPELEENTSKLNSIIQSSDDAIISMDADGLITSWNHSAERIFGYTSEQMLGKYSTDTVPKEKMTELHYIIETLKTGEKISNLATRRITKDGRELDVLINVTPIIDSKGSITGLSKIVRDVTNQKRNEQLIIENEERLQLVLSVSDLGTWELNFLNNEIRYSKKYLEILGYTGPHAFTHAELIKHVHPNDIEKRERAMSKAITEGVLNYEFRIVRNDGQVRWIEAKGQVFYDKNNTAEKLIGTLRDITERRNRVDELRESEQKFRILADSVPQLIWTGDMNGNLNYFNLSLFEYTGLTPKQIHKDGWIQIVHPDDRLESVKQWAAAINEGLPFLTEHRFRRYDGEYRWHLSRALPQKDTHGITQMWVGTSTDVHDQKVFSEELEKNVQARTVELKTAIDELVKTNRELEQFAYVSSHDLQEPLRKIQAFSGMLSGKLDANDESKVYLDKINASAGRMSELIKDLLTYSRLSKTETLFVETDLNHILDKVRSDFEVLIQQKKAIVLSARLPTVKAIPIQMNQLIYNLIGNALKFCDNKPFIEISVQKATATALRNYTGNKANGQYHHLMFKDNGIGFSQEYAQQIFTIFQRLNSVSKYSGTGIGLAMCKKIVENHKGFISAESSPQQGATFHVFLPV